MVPTTLAYAISLNESSKPTVYCAVIRIINNQVLAFRPSVLRDKPYLFTFDEPTIDPCEGGLPYAQLEISESSLFLAINSSSSHTLTVEVLPFCFLEKSKLVLPSYKCNALSFAPPPPQYLGLIGPITFFIAKSRSRLRELNALLRVEASEQENFKGQELAMPAGFGKNIYSMPPFHKLIFSANQALPALSINALISPDLRYTNLFNIKPPKGAQGASLFRALLQDKIEILSRRSKDSDIIVLVSGIDSFIPAICLSRDAKLFLHVVASKHALGIFQAFLVRSFFRLTGLSEKLVIINTQWGVFPRSPSKNLINCEEFAVLGEAAFLHKYFIDIIAREYVSAQFRDPIIVTGDTLGIYSAFNGTLQRDRPFLLGRLRGSLRRLMKSRFLARVLASLFAPRFGWEEACARSLASVVFSAHSDGRFTSYIPNLSYMFEGFTSVPQHIYFKTVVKAFSPYHSIAIDFAGAIGFLHRALYLHSAVRRVADIDEIYGMTHSFVNTSSAFVPFFQPRNSIFELLFRPKKLQYSVLAQLIYPLSWLSVFDSAVNDIPKKTMQKLDATYYNLLDRFLRGPLGY